MTKQSNTKESGIGPAAAARYRLTYEGYVEAIRRGADLPLREYCRMVHTNQAGMYSWLRSEGLEAPRSAVPGRGPAAGSFPLFVESGPAIEYGGGSMRGGTFRDVTVRFPDGAMVRMAAGSSVEIVSMVSVHARLTSRDRGEGGAPCSR